jgi:Ca2+-binding RTX toxin-like protein
MAFVWKSEFQVSGNNGGSGGAPKVAVNHLGQAIVAWQDGSSVKGHAIDAFGNPTGADFTIAGLNTTATLDIDIAPLANGDFVVVHEFQFSATDMDVRYARITATGTPVSSGAVANEGTVSGVTVQEYDPQVTQASISDSDNDFAVVYARSAAGPANDIIMRQITGAGSIKSTTTVATGGATALVQPDVAFTNNGSSAAVIWRNTGSNIAQVSELRTFDLGAAWSADPGVPLFSSQAGVLQAPSIARVKLDPVRSNLSYATLGGFVAGNALDAVYTTDEDVRANYPATSFSGFTPTALRTVGLADNRGILIATDGTTARFSAFSATGSDTFFNQVTGISSLFDAASYVDERIILVERGTNPSGGTSINAVIIDPRQNGIVHDGSFTFGAPVLVGSEGRDIWARVTGGSTNFGLGGDDFVLGGASFSYTAQGGAGRDVLEGSPAADTLSGGLDADLINGNGGADAIDGGRGNDFLTGDAGLDVFHFTNGYGADTVTDFTPGTDKLDLTGMGLTSASQALAFASQVGSDTVFNFGAGDTITLQNVSKAALTSAEIVTRGFPGATLALGEFGASNAAGGWGSNNVFPRELADINGDGMADIVGFGNAGVTVALATGGGNFGPSSLRSSEFGASNSAGGWSSNDLFPRILADVNGDRMADIVGFGNAGVTIALATGGGNFGASSLRSTEFGASNSAGGWNSNNIFHREMGDVNGDGMADIVGFGIAGVSVARAVGGGNFGPAQLLSAEFGTSNASGGWTSQDLFPRKVADVDGDGGHRADIVGFGGNGVFVAQSFVDLFLV